MNRQDFQQLMKDHFDTIADINDTKGHDYAGDEDALANFKSAWAWNQNKCGPCMPTSIGQQ